MRSIGNSHHDMARGDRSPLGAPLISVNSPGTPAKSSKAASMRRPCWCVWATASVCHEDGDLGVTQHIASGPTEDEFLQAGMSVGAHNDQIGGRGMRFAE